MAAIAGRNGVAEASQVSRRAKREIDIEDLLVWTFRDQAIEAEIARANEARLGPGGSFGTLANLLRLGTRVDQSPHAGIGLSGAGEIRAPADAVTVWSVVARLSPTVAGLLAQHGRTATIPEWPDDRTRLVAMRDQKGRIRIDFDIDDRGRRIGHHCPVRLDPDPDLARFDREMYALWWHGMVEVRDQVAPHLEDWTVTGPCRMGPD